ncbi:uncharacterized protein PHACADRAFT_122015 [Phanerochaete carnosa HHB-10118-sp]|uniref:Phytocyanin domain-containing protein n=1 Tax=Phanerochaete carnosa (strain HHB-10118-sp) TaxID=650164 RepID=K5WZM7_PHACS|nr:uncharacterized protein PHACADRAFT_122015 [Phanerochaete carnosa HHB-10118-sp]EKM55962.1 hypothetical protein PHACADRAFT_122015 [Phanerochaete carnosa HHB-10118-sp]
MLYIIPNLHLILGIFVLAVQATEFQVVVGGPGKLRFDPQTVNASPGDVVTFVFKQSNHTATESTFESPCEMAPGGFDSGFLPVADNNTDGPFPAAQLTVSSTDPVWVYCRQTNHCQQGMVFAINPGDQFPAFQMAATGGILSTSPPAEPTSTFVTITKTSTTSLPITSSSIPTTSSSSTGSASPTSLSSDHIVVVGGPDILAFSPSNITAQIGDTVTFQFRQKNHTVTQSTFAAPCVALADTSTSGQSGFDSGFMPIADNATSFPTYTIQVNDTSPIWAFCRQVSHCGEGMVFSVNSPLSGSSSFAAFQAHAKQLNGTSASNTTNATTSTSSAGLGATVRWSVGRYAGVATTTVTLLLGLMI